MTLNGMTSILCCRPSLPRRLRRCYDVPCALRCRLSLRRTPRILQSFYGDVGWEGLKPARSMPRCASGFCIKIFQM